MNIVQLTQLHQEFDALQDVFGEKNLKPIYGAGSISNPDLMLIFMNPTSKNVSSSKDWQGIRAPWIGTKNIWRLLFQVGIFEKVLFSQTQNLKSREWDIDLAFKIYQSIADRNVYITNFAKCTQTNARPLNNSVFKSYRELLLKEISYLKPKAIITFGNQVSENLLKKKISVKNYSLVEYESIEISGSIYRVFPCYYPVGQGQRNMPLAAKRIQSIIKQV